MPGSNSGINILIAETNDIARKAISVEVGYLPDVASIKWIDKHIELVDPNQLSLTQLVILGSRSNSADCFETFKRLRQIQPRLNILIFDTSFRANQMADVNAEADFLLLAHYIVATQLVPKVRALFPHALPTAIDKHQFHPESVR